MVAAGFSIDCLAGADVRMQSSVDSPAVSQVGGYDAVNPRGKRRSIAPRVVSEDRILQRRRRQKLLATSHDIQRNFAIASWMVRKHLDYVATFDFHVNSDDRTLNNEIELMMAEACEAERLDIGGRFDADQLFRLMELRAVCDGDTGLALLASGQAQGIESDLIRTRDTDQRRTGGRDRTKWVDGVRINKRGGRPLAYAVHSRGHGGAGYRFQAYVSAANMVHHGFFSRFAGDQTRGVSPLAAALNPLRDVYESFDFALAKLKVSQLFALSIYRTGDQTPTVDHYLDSDGDGVDDSAGTTEAAPQQEIDFGSGPILMDMEPDERAEVLESKTPSSEMQAFSRVIIDVAIKSLDIPYSFYDESHTNFFGSRAAWLHYDRSCTDKRKRQVQSRKKFARWKLRQLVLNGTLRLPRSIDLVSLPYEYVPRGMPWWDPAKEISGDLAAVGGALDNPERITRARGKGDVYDNIDATARVMDYARQKNVPLSWAPIPIVVEKPTDAE